jgi:riboflavin kinase
MQLPWVKEEIEENLGFIPYPGTLDVRLTEESVKLRKALAEDGVDILPKAGFYSGKCYKATFKGLQCGIVIPEVPGYPEDKLEIIGPWNLRYKLKVSDGDLVEVNVMF